MGLDRRRSFEDPSIVVPALEELLRTSAQYGAEMTAYVFMPDHLHGLIAGLAENSDLLRCMGVFRRRTGLAHKRQHVDRLWQEGYDDRFLRSDEATPDVAAYIVANPIRAGLSTDIRAYRVSRVESLHDRGLSCRLFGMLYNPQQAAGTIKSTFGRSYYDR